MEDGRCKLGLLGRFELVMLVENGSTLRAAAAALGVAPATAHRWWHRWKDASPAERASRACLRSRSSRPRSCPWALSSEDEQAILAARARTNYGPTQLQFLCGRHRSTIWKVLARHGVSRQRRTARPQSTRRYEWTEAGALLHIDAFELPKFDVARPLGARRSQRAPQDPQRGQGQDHRRHRRPHPPGLLRDPLRRERDHRLGHAASRRPVVSRAGLWACAGGHVGQRQVLRHELRVPRHPHRARRPPHPHPAAHAAMEREDRALLRHPRPRMGARPHLASSRQRDRALSSFIRYYNRHRPHTACGGRPPNTRVHHLRGQDT
jgi:transposase